MDFVGLQQDWAAGELYPWLRERFGPKSEVELDRDFGRFLRDQNLSEEDLPEFEKFVNTEAEVRRWCWAENWIILSQDEDLVVMQDPWIPTLLEEVQHGCCKADYVVSIVLHLLRDSAHAFLGSDFEQRLRVMSEWTPWMESCDGHNFSYAYRLFGYRHAQSVDQAGAVQRVYDLRRCHPDLGRPPRLQSAQGWLCPIQGAHVVPKQLLVNKQTGSMSLVPA
ncbi:hypothetical protein IV102_35280 [bacterium]|nr:hypothetical protein [bacterium]